MTGSDCPHSGHGHIRIPRGLEESRKKRKEQQLSCGSCYRKFNAICSLHSHLRGDSYHYDHITKTAFPLKPCPKKPKWQDAGDSDSNSEDEENIPTYYTQSGKMIGKMTRYKRKQHKFKKVYKVDENEKQLEAETIKVELNPEYYQEDQEELETLEADPSNVSFEYPDASKALRDKDSVAKSIVFESDIFGNLPTEMLAKDKIKKELMSAQSESVSEAGTQTKDLPDIDDEMEKMVSDYSAEIGAEMAESSVNDEDMDHSGDETQEPANVEEPTQQINMQMTINLHSLETNPDGSLKIVVAEEDAGIFRTPQGEEILKALKEQAAKGVVAKNTQVVYNYTVPADSVRAQPKQQSASGSAVDKNESGGKKKKQRKYTPREPDAADDADYEMSVGADGIEAVVFMTREERISTDEAIHILNQCNDGMHEDKISKIQPLSAKGGEMYVVDLLALPDRRDIRHDKYLWIHCGKKNYPRQNPTISKAMYKVKLPNNSYSDGFQKNVFEPMDPSERYALVHYTGYESLFQPLPHGNRKYGNRAHHRTCPSVLEELRALSDKTDLSPTMIHKQIQSAAPEPGLRNVRTPRDLRQIRNFVFKAKRIAKKQLQPVNKNQINLDSESADK